MRVPWRKKSILIKHLRTIVFAVLMLLLPWATGLAATWKCTTAEGGVAYVNNHRSDYKHCQKIDIPGLSDQPAAPEPAPKGTWQYQQSRANEAPPKAPAGVDAEDQGSRVVRGAVYRVEHANGVVEYTNVPPGGRGGHTAVLFHYIATCRACEVHSSVNWATVPLVLDKYAGHIKAAARTWGVDAGLLRALIHAESGFDPLAVSGKGAQGLMQLMPATASSLGVSNAFDPAQNINGGAHYLAKMLKRFHGDERLAAAAYNAGPGAVDKYDGVPPYAQTRVYVDRVELLARRYREAGTGATTASGATGSAAR